MTFYGIKVNFMTLLDAQEGKEVLEESAEEEEAQEVEMETIYLVSKEKRISNYDGENEGKTYKV